MKAIDMFQDKKYHINNSSINIIFGNILQTKADVIVSSDDTNITMGGGVSGAIRQKEGTGAIFQDVKKIIPAEVGDVIVSTAGSLPQMYLFHLITCDYGSVGQSKIAEVVSKEDIQQYIIGHSIDKCFLLLHALDLKSIAFPAIGTGVARFPLEKVATVMSEAIARNLRKTNKSISVELYLLDRFKIMTPWDFLPVFEQFSAQEAISRMMNDQAVERLVTDAPITKQPSGKMPDIEKEVFISYSRKDSDVVKPIYEWIERAGFQCWLDVDGMFSGVSYKKVIVDAIKRSKVLLFMSSENSNKSRNVVSEVSIAMKYGKKIIPIRLDMSPYSESIEYDIINHDYVIYDKTRVEQSDKEILKKIASTLRMV